MLISTAQFQLFFLALTRIFAVLIHMPVLGGQSIPNQVRLAFGVTLAIVLIPWQPLPADAPSLDLFLFAAAILREIILGTLAGYAAGLTFGAMMIAAEAMGLASGFASSNVMNPALGTHGSSFNQLFTILATLFFVVIDGHHWFIQALQRTFVVFPLNQTVLPDSLATVLTMTSQLIAAGIQLSLPVMGALLLTDLALGLLSRVAPQIQVFFLGMPLKVGVSLVALSIAFGMLLPLLYNLYADISPRMLLLLSK